MANISIKDVPEDWAEALRRRAARNHRSLQGELMSIIEQAVAGGAAGVDASPRSARIGDTLAGGKYTIVGFDARGHPIARQGWKSIEQVAAELKARFPEPIADAPLAVDIIRAERDSR